MRNFSCILYAQERKNIYANVDISLEESNLFFYSGRWTMQIMVKDKMNSFTRFIRGRREKCVNIEREKEREQQIFPKFDICLRLFKQMNGSRSLFWRLAKRTYFQPRRDEQLILDSWVKEPTVSSSSCRCSNVPV